MNPCVCGHWHAATCPHCGCSIYEPDDGGLDYDQGEDTSCLGRGIYSSVPTPIYPTGTTP